MARLTIKDYEQVLKQKIKAHERLEKKQYELIQVNENQRIRLIQLTMQNDILRKEISRLQTLEKEFTDELRKGAPKTFHSKKLVHDDTDRPIPDLVKDNQSQLSTNRIRICMQRNHHSFEDGKCQDCGANEVCIGIDRESVSKGNDGNAGGNSGNGDKNR